MNASMKKITITTEYTAKGWKTTVTMPDGQQTTKTMRRTCPGCYESTTADNFEHLPEPVCEAADQVGPEISRYLNS